MLARCYLRVQTSPVTHGTFLVLTRITVMKTVTITMHMMATKKNTITTGGAIKVAVYSLLVMF